MLERRKVKSVTAWGYIKNGVLLPWCTDDETNAKHGLLDGETVVRVRITEQPARRAKKGKK